ncbi:hypothetical protein [Micromonospora endolithica]|uniref:hypothetical protein n=1 Tax=Micromonospora endolithica TaxID=230091 RepID=UPI0013150D35|nr:hypothetical protein [Micromonospora endolithica]
MACETGGIADRGRDGHEDAGPGTPEVVADTRLPTRLRRALWAVWPALAGYVAVRVVGLVTVAIWADARDARFGRLIGLRADAGWYLGIAEHGYDRAETLQSDMAFFPLYPLLVRLTEPLSPLHYRGTAIALAWLASLAAAWGLFAIGNHLYGRRTGILLAVAWGLVPHAIVESMAYTESLFTALAAWSLYAVLTGRWLTAGTLCLLAGATRPTATSLIPVVMLAALIALARRHGGWRPAVAILLAPLGWLGFVGWVGWRTGRVDGWLQIQTEGWRSTFDGGAGTLESVGTTLDQPVELQWYLIVAVLAGSLVLLALSIVDRQPWPLLAYSAMMLVTTIGASGYFNSKARFLLPAFALLLPVARGLAALSTARLAVILVGATAFTAYFGGYLLLVWAYSP